MINLKNTVLKIMMLSLLMAGVTLLHADGLPVYVLGNVELQNVELQNVELQNRRRLPMISSKSPSFCGSATLT